MRYSPARAKGYSTEPFRALFDMDANGTNSLALRHGMVSNYRAKLRQAGPVRIYDLYPIHYTRAELREAKSQLSTEAAEKQNDKDARMRFVLKAHANFGPGDLHLSLTFAPPYTLEGAMREARNYVSRLQYAVKTQGEPGRELRYMYVVEVNDETHRAHLHMLASGIDRDTAEAKWRLGWANADRIKPNGDAIMALSKYLAKGQRGKRRWNCSTNLVDPSRYVRVSDHKLSKHKVERICADSISDGRSIFEALAPGYRLMEPIQVKRSNFLAGAYVQVRMINDGYYQAYRADADNRTQTEKETGEAYLARERASDNRTPKTRPRPSRPRGPSPGSSGRRKQA